MTRLVKAHTFLNCQFKPHAHLLNTTMRHKLTCLGDCFGGNKGRILTFLEIRGNKEESVDQSRPSRFLEDAELRLSFFHHLTWRLKKKVKLKNQMKIHQMMKSLNSSKRNLML